MSKGFFSYEPVLSNTLDKIRAEFACRIKPRRSQVEDKVLQAAAGDRHVAKNIWLIISASLTAGGEIRTLILNSICFRAEAGQWKRAMMIAQRIEGLYQTILISINIFLTDYAVNVL